MVQISTQYVSVDTHIEKIVQAMRSWPYMCLPKQIKFHDRYLPSNTFIFGSFSKIYFIDKRSPWYWSVRSYFINFDEWFVVSCVSEVVII